MVTRRIGQWPSTGLLGVNTLLAGMVVWLAVSDTVEVSQVPNLETDPANAQVPPATPENMIYGLSFYQPLWQRDLRQPPIPPSPPAPLEAPPPPPPLELPRLVGTFVEAGAAYGHFEMRDGRTRIQSLDSKLEGYDVAAIQDGKAKLTHGSNEYWLEVPRHK
jgi:hypothetical protein